jgi:cholesterol transport system auxiliary component
MFRKVLSLAAFLLLAGCIHFGPKVPKQLLTLTPEATAPSGQLATGASADAILVLDPEADPRLDVQRVPVQITPSSVAYLKDAQWAERPARELRHLLAETIRAHSTRLVLEGEDIGAKAREILAGRLVDMGYDAPSQSVVVRYDGILHLPDGTVQSRRFESVIPGIAPKAAAVAPALNQAANDVAKQVADWVG